MVKRVLDFHLVRRRKAGQGGLAATDAATLHQQEEVQYVQKLHKRSKTSIE